VRRKMISAAVKAKAVLEALRGEKTLNEIASTYGVHPNQLGLWRKQAVESLPEIFSSRRVRSETDHEALTDRLYKRIGQLEVELDWLKKKTGLGD
jgi:transposase-like protein